MLSSRESHEARFPRNGSTQVLDAPSAEDLCCEPQLHPYDRLRREANSNRERRVQENAEHTAENIRFTTKAHTLHAITLRERRGRVNITSLSHRANHDAPCKACISWVSPTR